MTRTTARLGRIAAGLIAGSLVLAGCSDASNGADTDSSASQSANTNDSDIDFAQSMIPHHRQAIEMAQLADGRAQDPRVLDLADRVAAAQDPEIETMSGWLEEWGEDVPDDRAHMDGGGMDGGGMGGGGMGGGGMGGGGMGGGGMMSEVDMGTLGAMSGAEFDRMWLTMMIEHHTGAVNMALTEVAEGQNADVIDLAEQIVRSQGDELDEMKPLLAELGG